MCKIYGLRGRGEAPGDVVEKGDSRETSEGHGRRYFGEQKGSGYYMNLAGVARSKEVLRGREGLRGRVLTSTDEGEDRSIGMLGQK